MSRRTQGARAQSTDVPVADDAALSLRGFGVTFAGSDTPASTGIDLDLRPGRALKASAAVSIAAGASGPGAAGLRDGIVAVSAVCMRGDLQGKTMLGDLGANAIGAALGYSLALAPGAFARWSCLCGVVALTLASEKLSFSKVIEETPILAWADRLGRR